MVNLKIISYAIVALLVFTVGYKTSSFIWSNKYDKLVIKIQKEANNEIQRQIKINKEEQEKQKNQVLALQTQIRELEKVLEENNNEAEKDANANSPSLNTNSVQRLNKLR